MGRPRLTSAQLLKQAAEAEKDANRLLGSIVAGMPGVEAIPRLKEIQRLIDRARKLREKATAREYD